MPILCALDITTSLDVPFDEATLISHIYSTLIPHVYTLQYTTVPELSSRRQHGDHGWASLGGTGLGASSLGTSLRRGGAVGRLDRDLKEPVVGDRTGGGGGTRTRQLMDTQEVEEGEASGEGEDGRDELRRLPRRMSEEDSQGEKSGPGSRFRSMDLGQGDATSGGGFVGGICKEFATLLVFR